jgi:integrase
MPQRKKGPRLWLRERSGRPSVWVILDGAHEHSTGCTESQLEGEGGAREKLRDYLVRTTKVNTNETDLSKILCADVLMLYSDFIPEDSPSIKTRRYHIANLLPFWESKTLADVKGSTCRQYLSFRSGHTGSPDGKTISAPTGSAHTTTLMQPHGLKRFVKSSTARHELKTLQAAINHWHRESPLKAVPKVTLPKPGERRERVLERSEVARMLWAARKLKLPHVARFILIGLYTGTRHDAILRLRWEASQSFGHIDLARGVIFRRGASERETSKRRPPVQVPGKLLHRIQRWKAQDLQAFSEEGLPTIIHYNGTRILKMKRAWKSVVKAAGLGPDVTPHVLRHTCVSWNLWAGKTIWEVAGIVGADASTIDRIYGHHRKVD